jgi:hypothetical protein
LIIWKDTLSEDRSIKILWCLWVVFVLFFGLPSAYNRQFHVDEFQIAYNISLLASAVDKEYLSSFGFYMLPFINMLKDETSTINGLLWLRLSFFTVFLCSLTALAYLQPFYKGAIQRVVVLAGISMSFLLWKHGFEIRPDTFLVLCEVLFIGVAYLAIEGRISTKLAVSLVGLLTPITILISLKSIAYVFPFSLLCLVFSLWANKNFSITSLLGSAILYAASFFISGSIMALIYHVSGFLEYQVEFLFDFFHFLSGSYRFSPFHNFEDVFLGNPILLIFSIIGLVELIKNFRCLRKEKLLLHLCTWAFFLWAVVVQFINPTPFPYNEVHLIPFFFLTALSGAKMFFAFDSNYQKRLVPICVLLGLGATFVHQYNRDQFFQTGNEHQFHYISTAESLSDYREGKILDGVGMVLSRPPVSKNWMLHSLLMNDYKAGSRETFANIIEEKVPEVVISNYRWGWLGESEFNFLSQRYKKIAPQMYVLGGDLGVTEDRFLTYRAGRYIVQYGDSEIPVKIDGSDVEDSEIVFLEAGSHTVNTNNVLISYLWIGPRANKLPAIGGNALAMPLFQNH